MSGTTANTCSSWSSSYPRRAYLTTGIPDDGCIPRSTKCVRGADTERACEAELFSDESQWVGWGRAVGISSGRLTSFPAQPHDAGVVTSNARRVLLGKARRVEKYTKPSDIVMRTDSALQIGDELRDITRPHY